MVMLLDLRCHRDYFVSLMLILERDRERGGRGKREREREREGGGGRMEESLANWVWFGLNVVLVWLELERDERVLSKYAIYTIHCHHIMSDPNPSYLSLSSRSCHSE